MTAVIAITSGKAGAGKSILSANLAQHLNHKGHRTGLLVAGDRSPLWGIAPDRAWPNILGARLPLDQAIHRDVFGVDLMVTQSHGHALIELSTQTAHRLDDPMDLLNAYAYLLVDMAAGLAAPALACCLAATEVILVLTPDTPALTAAYEWLAHLVRHDFAGPVNIVLNQVRKAALAQSVYLRFRDLTHKRLRLQTNLWGTMGREETIDPTDMRQMPLSEVMPRSKLLRDIQVIGDRLVAEQPPENQTLPLKDFWQQFIVRLKKLPALPVTPSRPVPEPARPAATDTPSSLDLSALTEGARAGRAHGSEDNSMSLAQLNKQLTTIAQELNAIRRLLETRGLGNGQVPHESHFARPHVTVLDFDAYVIRYQKEQSEDG